MFDEELWQYGLVAMAIAAIFLLKSYIVKKQYSHNLTQFVHP